MKKNLIKIVIILGLIFVNLFCCSFFQIVSAGKISNVPYDELIKILEGPVNYDTPDYLQYAACNSKKAYFDFDAQRMVNQSKKVDIYDGDNENYSYNSKSVICISPADHNVARKQTIECILDISSEGVTAYTKGNKKVTKRDTKDSKKKKALEYADQLAYFAFKAVENGEDKVPPNFQSYKSLMRFQTIGAKFEYFHELGVPNDLDPKAASNYNPSGAYYQQKLDEFEKATKKKQYTARFIFLQGYFNGSDKSGQNDSIFSAFEETKISLKIKKVNEEGEPLQGVKFKIFRSSKDKEKGDLITEETTNKNGIINFDGAQGEWYYIKEVETVGNYEIADPDHQVIKLTKDKQEVKFVNELKDGNDFDLTIVKSSERGKKLSGAKFVIYKNDGGTKEYLKKNNTYTKTDFETIKNDQAYIYTTDKKGKIQLKNLEPGTYYAIEIQAPTGYIKIEEPIELGKITEKEQEPIIKQVKNMPDRTRGTR